MMQLMVQSILNRPLRPSPSPLRPYVKEDVATARFQGALLQRETGKRKSFLRLLPWVFASIFVAPCVDQNVWWFGSPPTMPSANRSKVFKKRPSTHLEFLKLQEAEASFVKGIQEILQCPSSSNTIKHSQADLLPIARQSLKALKQAPCSAYYLVTWHQQSVYLCKIQREQGAIYVAMSPAWFEAKGKELGVLPCVGSLNVDTPV